MARPQRLRRLALLAAMVTALAAAAVAIAIFSSNSTEAAAGSAQNPITILSPWEGSEERAFARRLFAGKLRFDHASVIAALRRMTTILDDPYVAGGIRGALETNLGDGITLVFGQKPRAHLYMEGGFVGGLALQYIRPKPKPGTTIDHAPFPTIDPRFGSPLVGGTNLAAAFVDNDGVRELLLYLSSPAAGKVWVSSGAVVSPNKRVPSSAYPNVLVRKEAKQVARATVFVSDGSDLLPGSLGEEWGATLQEVIQNSEDILEIVRDFQRTAAHAFKK